MLCSFILCLCFTSTAFSQFAPNVWDVLRKQFTLNHETNRAEIRREIKWIVSHPTYLKRLVRSEPYIYHILSEVRRRRLPGEIALIPLIESAYDPFAYSGAGAAGLWQLMPGTGKGLGLKKNWWYDERRSIGPSTNAALNYLAYLNKYFQGNWLLAIAAYDSGEGTISRLIKKSRNRRKPSFWSLRVPRETKAYIPRLLALAAIINHPSRYHVKLPNIPHSPYFEEVNVGSQIDLNHAARLANISYKELIKLNPGYNRWTTAPYHPYKLLIPVDKVKIFYKNLAKFPHEKRVSWERHEVRPGENLILLAKKYHTNVHLLKDLNHLSSNTLKSGQKLLIPSQAPLKTVTNHQEISMQNTGTKTKKTLNTQHYKIIHTTKRKETYAKLVKRYGVSEEKIRQWNMIGPHVPLTPGQQLVLWKDKPLVQKGIYIIKKGDTLSQIAHQKHISMAKLLKINPKINKNLLKPGQKLLLA